MPQKTDTVRPLISLQYLRAIAALLVVYLHAVIQVNTLSPRGSPVWFEVGKCGVDIFFVLSGYVMWISTAGRGSGVTEFLKRRFVRIVPLYWIVTLLAATVALLAPRILNSTRFEIHHVLASLFFVPWRNPVVPYVPGGDLTEVLKPIITPGWTLNFEMYFYAQFAIALCVPQKWRLAALTLIIICMYLLCLGLTGTADAFAFYGSPLVFEFLSGSALAVAVGATRAPRGTFPAVVLVVFAFVVLLLDDAYFPERLRAAVLGPPALLLVGAMVAIERAGRLPIFRWLDELGNASYSIYITHIFAVAGMRIVPRTLGLDPLGLGQPFFVLACLVTAAAAGLAVHRMVEKPLIKRLSRGRLPVAMTIEPALAAASPSTSAPSPPSQSS
jgi:exopolysaccharide production protein ExoZ